MVRGAFIKWSGRNVRCIRWSGGCICVVNMVMYVLVRKVYEEVRRVHGVIRGAYIKWSGRRVCCIRWSGGLSVL